MWEVTEQAASRWGGGGGSSSGGGGGGCMYVCMYVCIRSRGCRKERELAR